MFLLTFLSLHCGIPIGNGRSLHIAYDIATGGSPFSFMDEIKPQSTIIWIWVGLFHVIAWLVIPVLIAATLDAMYRVYEEKRSQAENRLARKLRKYAQLSGIPEAELDDFVSEGIDFFRNMKQVEFDKKWP
jgi:hypothetical protein